jgi:putative ABC transport system permease protein
MRKWQTEPSGLFAYSTAARWIERVAMLKNYIKIAFKVLMRRKFFTFVSLFGITCTLVVLFVATTAVDHIYNPARSGTDFERCLFVESIELKGESYHIISSPSYDFLNRYVKSMVTPEMVSIHSGTSTVISYVGNRKLELQLKYTDAAFWKILDFDFIYGTYYDSASVENAEHVAVITERTKKAVFGDRSPIGEYLETTSGNYQIIGVIAHEDIPAHNANGDIFAPITLSQSAMNIKRPFSNCSAYILARNRSDFGSIKNEFATKMKFAEKEIAEDGDFTELKCAALSQAEIAAGSITENTLGGNSMLMLAGIIGLMILFMLFPAINLINLNVSRIIERSSEIGVRKAFGASSTTLVGQFLVENLILTMIGGIIALILAIIIIHIITNSGLIPFGRFGLNIRVVTYSLLIVLFFGVLSGVLPAYRMSRLHPVEALRGTE